MHRSTGIWRAAGLALLFGSVLLSSAVHSGSAVLPGSKAAALTACVAPTSEIRRNHMDYLKHDRDMVVRKGVRQVKNSLAGCIDCHAGKDDDDRYRPVDGQGQFCSGCHEYLAVSLTCFQCHSNRPEPREADAAASNRDAGGGVHDGQSGLLTGFDDAPALSADEMAQLRAYSREE